MWISTKTEYGLRALIEIGRRPGGAVPLKDVAASQDISQHYLEQIAAQLRRSGFLRSQRGAHGGYRLARDPGDIRVWDVVIAMEGSVAPVGCLDGGACDRLGLCPTETLWQDVEQAIYAVLSQHTLQDLIERQDRIDQRGLVQLQGLPQG